MIQGQKEKPELLLLDLDDRIQKYENVELLNFNIGWWRILQIENYKGSDQVQRFSQLQTMSNVSIGYG